MPLGHSQSEQKSKTFWNPKKPDGDPRSSGTTSIACQSLLKIEARMSPLCSREKRNRARWINTRRQGNLNREMLISQKQHAGPTIPSSAPVARSRRGADPTVRGCNSTLTRALASPSLCLAIDTAPAAGRDGNGGYWRRRPHADSHRLPGVARGRSASAQRDSAMCHQTGRQSRDQ